MEELNTNEVVDTKEITINTLKNLIKLIEKDKVEAVALDLQEVGEEGGLFFSTFEIGVAYEMSFDKLSKKLNKGNY